MHSRLPLAPVALAGVVFAASAYAQGSAPEPAPPPAMGQPPLPAPAPEQAPPSGQRPAPQSPPGAQAPQGGAPQQPQPAPQQARAPIPIRTIIGFGVGQNCQYDASYEGQLTPAPAPEGQAQGAPRYSSRVKIRASVACPNQPPQRSVETVTTGPLRLGEIEDTLALRGTVIAPGQPGRQCLYMPIVGLSANGLTGSGVQFLCPMGGGAAIGGGPAPAPGNVESAPSVQPAPQAPPPVQAPPNNAQPAPDEGEGGE